MTHCALVFTFKMHLYAAAENDADVEIFLHDTRNYTTQYMQM